jgi:NhaP-type Na+/H+ or K+/H+ antiporter
VVTDRRLPVRIRQGLNVESGLNDGICVPLLFIVLAVAEAEDDAITVRSAVHVVLDEIGWGLVGGVVAGVAAGVILRVAHRRNLVADHWVQVIPLAGAALSYGIAVALGGSGFIAAFVAGLVFGVLERADDGEVTFLVDSGGQILNAVTLIVFGAVALGPALHLLDWRIALYAVLSLTVVRILPVAVAMLGTGARRQTVLFVGWFGPRGLASIVFGLLVIEQGKLAQAGLILQTTALTVGLSVLAHGITAAPLARRYAAWFNAHPSDGRPVLESGPGPHVRWRRHGATT